MTKEYRSHFMTKFQRVGALFIITLIPVSLLLLLLSSAWAAGQEAQADTLCVKPGGGDGCLASISAALALAEEQDVIRVAAGQYTENLLISQTVTLQGG